MTKDKDQGRPVTHVAVVLDRSGSMEACRAETISGFNEQVQKIVSTTRQDGTADSTFVTLVLFNQDVTFLGFARPAGSLKEITEEEYVPEGTTAMLDAVGMTLTRFEQEVEDGEDIRYLVVVISDGQENDSKEYTYESIAEMIQKRQQTDRWTFSYMGANQDLSVISKRLNIPKSNLGTYVSDPRGTQVGFESLSRSMIGFLGRQAASGPPASGPPASDKFFRDEDEIRPVEDDADGSDDSGGPLLH